MEQTIQTQKKPETSPKDFFLHLLSIVALYASAISFSTLLFQLINSWFPDTLGQYYMSPFSVSAMRWAVAMLIVFFPAYVVTNIFLNKEYRVVPEKKNLHIRKWLLYFTLFVTTLIILGDIVALVLNFMQGELTLRFIFKVFTILFVAGSILGYYLWELKNSEYGRGIKTFIYIISAIIFISVVAGFTVAGSPAKERARKFDEQRVSNLSSIQWQIVEYWRSKESLPNELSDLNDPLRGFYVPRDPDTGKKYEYIKKGEMSFELCATFSRPSEGFYPEKPHPVKDAYMGGLDEYWEHGEGRTCFERTIDRDFYPPVSSQR